MRKEYVGIVTPSGVKITSELEPKIRIKPARGKTRIFQCECHCGKTFKCTQGKVLTQKGCGCGQGRGKHKRKVKNKIAYVGTVYPSGIAVLSELEPKMMSWGRKMRFFECKCHCGKIFVSRGGELAPRKSCGCLAKNIGGRLQKEESAFNDLYKKYARGAPRRGYAFELTREEFRELTKMNCTYCGIEPSSMAGVVKNGKPMSNGLYVYNGIDRVDNSIGYTKGNCVACCSTCNFAKRDSSVAKFEEWLDRVAKFRSEKVK
jgi:hypothetical protein